MKMSFAGFFADAWKGTVTLRFRGEYLRGVRPVKYIRSIYETRDNAEKYLRNSLLVSDKKIQLANDVIRIQKPVLDSLDLKKISLYVSIPFCPSCCSYCSFISASGEGALKLIDDYFGLLLKELDIYADIVKRFSLKVDTVYIGGWNADHIVSLSA